MSRRSYLLLLPLLLASWGCTTKDSGPSSPHKKPTKTATSTPTLADTATETSTPTETLTATPTPTLTITLTFTDTPSDTSTFSPTDTSTQTLTDTLTLSPTGTDTLTMTPSPTITLTFTNTPTPTITLTPTITNTFTVTPTFTACGAPATIGTNTNNASFGSPSSALYNEYSATSGTLGKVWAYLSVSAAASIQVAVYKTNGSGTPVSVVAASAIQSVPVGSFSWVSFDMPAAHLDYGTYALCLWRASGSINGGLQSGPSDYYLLDPSGGSLANMPLDTFDSTNKYYVTMYMTYCPDGVPPPTATPTVTATLTATPPCASSFTFGQTTYNDFNSNFGDSSLFLFSNFTPSSSGTLEKIWLHAYSSPSSPATVQVAAYTVDGSGHPLSPISVSAVQAVTSLSGNREWIPVNVPPTAITGGTPYALGFRFVGTCCGVGMMYSQSDSGINFGLALANGDLSNPPSSANLYSNTLAIYGEYCPDVAPTATPSATATPTVTQTYTPCGAPVSFGAVPTSIATPPLVSVVSRDQVYFSDYVPASSGTLRKIWIYTDSSAALPNNVQVALYDVDGSGYPQNALSVSGNDTLAALGWYGFNMPAVSLSAGTTYATCMWWNTGVAMDYGKLNGGNNFGVAEVVDGSLANRPSGSSFNSGSLATFAELCP